MQLHLFHIQVRVRVTNSAATVLQFQVGSDGKPQYDPNKLLGLRLVKMIYYTSLFILFWPLL